MKNQIKKILFIGLYPNEIDNYSNVFFRNLIWALADQGVECTVISPISVTKYKKQIQKISNLRVETTTENNKVKVYHPKYISFSSKSIGSYNTVYLTESAFENAVLKTIDKNNLDFDAVYGHFILRGGLAAIKVGVKYKKPSFLAYGECDLYSEVTSVYKKLNESNIGLADGIISVSSKNSNELIDLNIIDKDKIELFPNSINPKMFYPKNQENSRLDLNMPLKEFIVGFAGGFIERKGDKRLLEAAKDLKGVKLAFLGKGVDEPSGENVVFCKSLPHDKVSTFMNSIDILVLPTLKEGCCNAIIEAMACKKPIISSDLSFNYDILNNSNSLLVDPMNIQEIKDAIKSLRDDVDLREKLADGAYKKSKELDINDRAANILAFITLKSQKKV